MTLTLHQHPFASYCWKALIALYDRGVEFDPVLVEAPEDWDRLAELYPMAKMPVLVDQQAKITMYESSAVIEYLDRFGEAPPMIPRDRDLALNARLRDRIFDNYVMSPMQKIVLDNLRPDDQRDEYGVAEAREGLRAAYAMLDDLLAGRQAGGPTLPEKNGDSWAAGPDFTIADCSGAPSLHYALAVERWDEEQFPDLTAYYEKLMARPSVARVVDEARPYRQLFPPGWPDYVD